jgi:hypothetical protein
MPSSYSSSLRLTLQFAGEGINTWGDVLNSGVFRLVDYSIAGWLTKALTGDVALSSANGVTDEARVAMLKFTGAGPFNVTIPSVSKAYKVWNACFGLVTITTGAGTTATIQSGEIVAVICDGSNVKRVVATDFASARLTSIADPTGAQDAATKAYADALAFTANAGILPGQVGSDGKALIANLGGVGVAGWKQLTSADLSDTAARDAAAQGQAIAFAVAL